MRIEEIMVVLRKYFPNATVSESGDGELVLNTGFQESSTGELEEMSVDNHSLDIAFKG
jgi:hypothetical protein